MEAIIQQFKINYTLFYQFAIFAITFFVLGPLFFRPYLRLFELRRQRTVEDKLLAEKAQQEAAQKKEEYLRTLNEAKQKARQTYEASLEKTKAEEAKILSDARNEAKTVISEAIEEATKRKGVLLSELQNESESLAAALAERILGRK